MVVLNRDADPAARKITFPCFEAQMEGHSLPNQIP